MATKRAATQRKKSAGGGILLRYRDRDSAFGVSRKTTVRMADALGVSETQVIHVALAHFARQTLPRYELDNGPLTDEQMDEIRRRQPAGRMKVKESLL
jgi:hypothetical protein